ncbi:hypothetical protein C2S53_000173 [Perilla frutescens var. hirtella]|uniref:Uncharacterized protein n=1 Tax=Perilla frutescens var. hirtella TaxID=608512 RepID=A0AAD4JE13_PERFH|nr:hypothetical protein C2S53_000173 [Perilla frutescens var. hirtella]
MEESEKRRERLKAMRMEAADAAVDANSDRSGLASAGLSNPLVEGDSISSVPTQYFSPRFDYYTDPMAAFSGNKRRDSINPQVSHGRHNMLPRPTYQGMNPELAYQTPGVNSTDQRIFQEPGAHFNQSLPGRPMEYQTPGVNSPDQRVFQVPGPHYNQSPLGRPMEWAVPSGRPQGNAPNAWGEPGRGVNYTTPSNMSRGSNFGNPSFGQMDSPYYGRDQRYNSSSHYGSGRGGSSRYPDSGRGRGRSLSNTPGSRMSGRRGGSHESVSAEVRPDLYYRKEMIEDPWKMLSPVILKVTHARDTGKSWLPKSITMKKAKVSTEFPKTSISQQSLAEYLASSFSDSTDEPVQNEPGL